MHYMLETFFDTDEEVNPSFIKVGGCPGGGVDPSFIKVGGCPGLGGLQQGGWVPGVAGGNPSFVKIGALWSAAGGKALKQP